MKHWIERDDLFEEALRQFKERQRLANKEMKLQQQIERQKQAMEPKREKLAKQKMERQKQIERQQQAMEQEIERQRQEMEQQQAIQKMASQEFQQHVDLAFSPQSFHSVDIEGLISAHSDRVDVFLILGTLMQATVNRVQSLVRQNDVLQAQNAMLHAENRAQNAVIDQLISQINHQQPHAADRNTAIAASMKHSQEQLQHAAHRCHQCFSAEAAQ